MSSELPALALAAWRECDPAAKCRRVLALAATAAWPTDAPAQVAARESPGRPAAPPLVPPQSLARRGLGSNAGRAAFYHALAHIEFTAINLALDAALRFTGLPREYYADWLSVAVDEATHFGLLCDRLDTLDTAYGDLPAHGGLWETAAATEDDALARMALVPRVHEARGLDVTPGMLKRLRQAGDEEGVAVLETILREEIRHVGIGSRWFAWLCAKRGLAPEPTFLALVREHFGGNAPGPLNVEARLAAGFSEAELAALAG